MIPPALRKRLGIKNGSRVALTEKDGALLVQPVMADSIRSLEGSLNREKRIGKLSALEFLLQERRKDRDR